MSTTAQLVAARTTAGARYVAAIAELRASYGDLAAIEKLLVTNRVAYTANLQTFGERPDVITLRHPTYAPNVGGSFEDDVLSAFATRSVAWPASE